VETQLGYKVVNFINRVFNHDCIIAPPPQPKPVKR